ncbi:MAG: AMP-binding protein [Nostoc sp. NMS4]|nr:AMP-binding protein [Nostoc sp. NMS4]
MHHIVSDGWSIGVFVKELAALYDAYAQDKSPNLLPLPIQYADFALWQRQWLQGDVLQSQLNYWQKQLKEAPALLPLPTDRPRPAVQTFAGAHKEFALSLELTQKLTQLSQQQGCTVFMTLLAAFDTLLYRYTEQTDILVGTPIANRDRSEIEGLIGFFINTLVMRTNLAGNPSFSELLGRVRFMAMEAYTYQNLPFEMLVEALQPERNLSHSPLFQVMFVLENAPISTVELTGLSVNPLKVKSTTAKFDLTLGMENTATGLVGVWEYNTDLFDADTIERLAGHFVTLLESIVANPQQRISQLPLLTQPEQQQLLVEWNNTQADYPLDKCLHQLFEEQVARTPDAVAVVFENQQLTYHELNCRANELAHYLQSLGVGADVLVSICVKRSLDMVVGLLGILKAGGAYMPLDPEYPQDRLSFMVDNAQAKVLLTQQHLVNKLPDRSARIICLDSDRETIGQNSNSNPANTATPGNLIYVIYTSGSTGKPKGAGVYHRGFVNLVNWLVKDYQFTSKDSTVMISSCADVCSAYTVEQADEFSNKSIPIGKPLPNVKLHIMDQDLQLVPVGVIGELCIAGIGVGIGYINDLQRTNEKFIPNPFSDDESERLYKTGDLVRYLDDGNMEYLGRIDNQVKIRGFRIELGEIETVLNTHPQIQQAVVVAREDIPGDQRLVAYLAATDKSLTTYQLREFLKHQLPEYMVLSAIAILESLPLTPSGKVDRRALPKPDLQSGADKYVAPRTPIEEMLTQLWAQVLKVEQVGIHDNFFELGGHSLLATQLISRIRKIFQVELPLRELFATATVGELAKSIRPILNISFVG